MIPFYRARPLAILNDNVVDVPLHHEPDTSKTDLNSWHALGTRAERIKENNPIPTKWTSYKVYHSPPCHSFFPNHTASHN